eukprot:gene24975-30172_t
MLTSSRYFVQAVARDLRAGSGQLGAVRGYHENIIDHYENPRNVGSLDKNKKNIIDAKFKTFGCGSAIASSSVATEWLKGKLVDDCLNIKNTDIAQHLKLPPVKLHCSMLAEDAIKAAIKDYQAKQPRKEEAKA